MSSIAEKLAKEMAGEITLSSEPGKTLKKWREIFGITQTDLARYLETHPSVISDYESGRRKSPGASVIKKIVTALIEIDDRRGGEITKAFEPLLIGEVKTEAIIDIREFSIPVKGFEVLEATEGELLVNRDQLSREIYGYTVINSLKAILEFSSEEFIRLYGWTNRRALIFTKVTAGRSPMIAIRVSPMKPGMVVLHGVEKMDELGLRIAEIEKIPLIISRLPLDELVNKLRQIG